jgi:ABC-type phosphate/phosphonate transport system ATPase subunit
VKCPSPIGKIKSQKGYADRVVALRGGRKLLDVSVNAFDQNAFQELYGAHPG